MDDTCSVDGCDKPRYQRRMMCGSHTMKAYRHGDPTYKHVSPHVDLTGQHIGALTPIERRPDGKWLCSCDCGNTTITRVGDLNRGRVRTCGDKRAHRTEATSYTLAHTRLRRDRGPASAYECTDCGKQARHWSYNHLDPNEQQSDLGPFSASTAYYEPRCVSCHKKYDLAHLVQGVGGRRR